MTLYMQNCLLGNDNSFKSSIITHLEVIKALLHFYRDKLLLLVVVWKYMTLTYSRQGVFELCDVKKLNTYRTYREMALKYILL